MTIMLAFAACGGGETTTEETVIETILCADRCQKACCLGCKATEGEIFNTKITHTLINGHIAYEHGNFNESRNGMRLTFNS